MMDTGGVPRSGIRHSWADAWIITGLAESTEPVALLPLIERMDVMQHAVVTFDELSYGLQRLIAAGLVEAAGLAFRQTSTAEAINKRIRARHFFGVTDAWKRLLGVGTAESSDFVGDTTLGRFPGLSRDDYEAAVTSYLRAADAAVAAKFPRDIRRR